MYMHVYLRFLNMFTCMNTTCVHAPCSCQDWIDERLKDSDKITYEDTQRFSSLENKLIMSLIANGLPANKENGTYLLVIKRMQSCLTCALTCVITPTNFPGLRAGYPKLDDKLKELIPSPDEQYVDDGMPGKLKVKNSSPQTQMPFLRSGSVDEAAAKCKKDNAFPVIIPDFIFNGVKRPFTNIPQVLYKFLFRSCCMLTCEYMR